MMTSDFHFDVVSVMSGSLPNGSVVISTPIFGVSPTPDFLKLSDLTLPDAQRTEIDLGGKLAFLIYNVVSAVEARKIIELTEKLGYRDEAPGIQTPPGMRMNKTVHWVSDEAFLAPMFARIRHLLPQEIDGQTLHIQFSHRINMYKYDSGDVFNKHIDGDWPGYGIDLESGQMTTWPGAISKLTMLLYLNGAEDGVTGGETLLFGNGGAQAKIIPTVGSALFFRHGHSLGSVAHVGSLVTSVTPKYVARINVLYEQL
jgi:hypothetical protein